MSEHDFEWKDYASPTIRSHIHETIDQSQFLFDGGTKRYQMTLQFNIML